MNTLWRFSHRVFLYSAFRNGSYINGVGIKNLWELRGMISDLDLGGGMNSVGRADRSRLFGNLGGLGGMIRKVSFYMAVLRFFRPSGCGIIRSSEERGTGMELSEKIQKLRKDRGLTQEQFAQMLFVSRTAVSKWETGRGIPSMESLQMIARLCDVTLDDLLGAEEAVSLAQKENRENMNRFALYMDGLCNLAALMGLLLPLYKVELEGSFYSVPLYQLDSWLGALYWAFPLVMAL